MSIFVKGYGYIGNVRKTSKNSTFKRKPTAYISHTFVMLMVFLRTVVCVSESSAFYTTVSLECLQNFNNVFPTKFLLKYCYKQICVYIKTCGCARKKKFKKENQLNNGITAVA